MSDGTSALVGFAVLRANYDAAAPSYVDNFQSFVTDVLVRASPRPLSRAAVASEIRVRFGLTIPDLVVGKILKRAIHSKLVDRVNDSYVATDRSLKEAPTVSADIARYARQQSGSSESRV